MRIAAAVCALALGFSAAACGERSEPTGPSSELYPVTVTTPTDQPLVIQAPPKRIAVIAPEVTGIISGLGAGNRIVGTPVAENGAIRLDELASLQPDLVVASSSQGEDQIARARARTRAPVYIVEGGSIRRVERAISQLGLITDTSVAARRLIAGIEDKRTLVANRLRNARPVSVFVDTGFFTTVPDDSLVGSLVSEARGRNVAGRDPDAGPFDLRKLLRLNPDFYLATSDSGTTLADLRKNRRTRKLAAIRRGRYATVDVSLLAPGPKIGDGLLAVARAIHPDAFR